MKARLSGARRLVTRRPWVSSTVAVIVVGAGVGTYLLTAGSQGSTAAAATTTRLVSVSTGTVRQSVSATGTLAPADEEDVSFSSSAQVTSVRVSQGQRVIKGQVLGTIATVSLEATLAQAQADLATAKSTLATAEDDSSSTTAQRAADKAAVTSARSTVSDARTALADATLHSPITGTVAEVNVSAGDTASGSGSATSGTSSASSGSGSGTGSTTGGSTSGGSTSGGSTSGDSTSGGSTSGGSTSGGSTSTTSASGDFVVIGMRSWTVSASVDDTEVGLIGKGDQVQLTTDNVTGTVFGTVSSVSVLSSSTSGSATYPVEIAVTGSPSGLHDGASATVSIIYRQLSNVRTVSTQAIHRDGTSSYVYVSKNGSRTRQTVTTGIASDGVTQVKSGLTSGQQVYVETVARTGGSARTAGTNTRSGNNYPGGGNAPGGNFPGGNGGGFPGGNR